MKALPLILGGTAAGVLVLLLSRTRAAISKALQEKSRWEDLSENDREAAPLLDKYWASVGTRQPPSVAWSAAFISYVMAQTQPDFPVSSTHIGYARGAYKNRGKSGLYTALPASTPVKAGDIVIKTREGDVATFDDVKRETGFKKAHGDILVSVRNGEAIGVGGNVGNRVNAVPIALNTDGTLKDPKYFAVLRQQPDNTQIALIAGGVFGTWWVADSLTKERKGRGLLAF
jgi:hypothetical protein